ncbi:hypothetical protein B0H13DRAFT_2116557 [Mycena leptocephala]|nr:hypothetical protein B0H13DRAFT_2116557 [Mycena leptocephala]
MPSEPPYTALVAAPGGAFPEGGLARDDFVAAARPVYMRIREHWSFHPDTPAPPPAPDSTTADEGLREGWLPPGTRVVGVGGGEVEVRVPAASHPVWHSGASVGPNSSFSTSTSAAGHSGMSGRRRGEETPYTYHTPLDPRIPNAAREHPAHDREGCLGCVRVRERERWERGRALLGAHEGSESGSEEGSEGEGEGKDDAEMEGGGSSGSDLSQAHTRSSGSFAARASTSEERSASPSSASAASAYRGYSPSSSPRSQAPSQHSSPSQDSTAAPWPEWSAPAWAAHRFDEDEGWEGACDGVQDVVFTGETDPRHGASWHHYEYSGRVRPWDGLIGLVMRPLDRTLGLGTYFISGHLVGRDTFEGTWQMAAQDVLAPSWGGSICLARAED